MGQGGSVLNKISRSARAQCDHRNTVTVNNSGLERTICEACGKVNIRANEGLSGSVSRDQFERVAERDSTTVG